MAFSEDSCHKPPIPHALVEPCHSPIKGRGVYLPPLNVGGHLWVSQQTLYGGNDTIWLPRLGHKKPCTSTLFSWNLVTMFVGSPGSPWRGPRGEELRPLAQSPGWAPNRQPAQLASHVTVTSWEWVPWRPAKQTQQTPHGGGKTHLRTNCRFMTKIKDCCCFKPLSSGWFVSQQ